MPHICLPVKQIFTRGTADLSKTWSPGEEITISFSGGTPFQQDKTKQYSAIWLESANLKFTFVPKRGQIRISFTPGGSWSHVGTDALDVAHQPTMNLGWITPDTPEDEIGQVILHEFGHMLGLEHEHQSPNAEIPWDKEAVCKWASGPPNYWGIQDIETNFFAPLDAERIIATNFDPESIMLYAIPAEFTNGKLATDWNSELSEMDKEIARKLYPIR